MLQQEIPKSVPAIYDQRIQSLRLTSPVMKHTHTPGRSHNPDGPFRAGKSFQFPNVPQTSSHESFGISLEKILRVVCEGRITFPKFPETRLFPFGHHAKFDYTHYFLPGFDAVEGNFKISYSHNPCQRAQISSLNIEHKLYANMCASRQGVFVVP